MYNTRLDSCSCQEHAHTRVCSALTYSFHQCPGIMLGFIRGMAKRAQLAPTPPGMKEALGPNMDYGHDNVI